MVSECHSVVRAPAARVTRLDSCCTPVDSACAFATTSGFVTLTLTKVFQERQDALRLNANGDICLDKPKRPILRWYEASIEFCNVDPELFNIVSNEPLILNDADVPVAIGWCTLPDSNAGANFGLEFWTGTEEDECDENGIKYGYGQLFCVTQGTIGDVTIGNSDVTFTVTGITKAPNNWGLGPYNVVINLSGDNEGFPGPRYEEADPHAHKCFFWTELPPPPGFCGCQELTPVLSVTPTSGPAATPRVMTFPLDPNGGSMLPAVVDWGDASPLVVVTSGTTLNHNYVAGSYTATFRSLAYSAPTYTSVALTVS